MDSACSANGMRCYVFTLNARAVILQTFCNPARFNGRPLFFALAFLCVLILVAPTARAGCPVQQKEFVQVSAAIAALDRQTSAATEEAKRVYIAKRNALRTQQSQLATQLVKPECVNVPTGPTGPSGPNGMPSGADSATPPDITLQARACAQDAESAQISNYLASALQDAQQQLPAVFTNPSFQASCVSNREIIGIWFDHKGTASDLNSIDILSPRGALMAIQLTPAAANTLVGDQWLQYQADNPPSGFSYGGFGIEFETPSNMVKTTLHVSASVVGEIKAHGTIDLSDTLSVTADGAPQCPPTQVEFNSDTSAVDAFFGFIAPMPVGGLFIDYINEMVLYQGQSQVYGEFNSDIQGSGLGCAFAALVPTVVLTPADSTTMPATPGGKLVFRWRKVSVSKDDGITFSTDQPSDIPQKSQARSPKISVVAPFMTYVYLKDAAEKQIDARLRIRLTDLRDDPKKPITITWSATNGKIDATADSGTYALATFPGLAQSRRGVGATSKIGSVTISATDADNITAGPTTFEVFARIEPNPPPPTKPKNGEPQPKQSLQP